MMKNIVAVEIRDSRTYDVVAIMRADETEFSDPHGGTFSDGEKWDFRRIAVGVMDTIGLHVGTKFQKRVKCHVTVIFA